jgi:hypothetical protein
MMDTWPAAGIAEPAGRPAFGIDSVRATRYCTLLKISRLAVPGMPAPVWGKSLKGRLPGNDTHTGEGNRHMVESSFAAIEKKISDLAALVVALKKDKTTLAVQLEKKETEVKELTKKIAGLTLERDQIRDKVETILARIESIEL